jgi:hypothetical protein
MAEQVSLPGSSSCDYCPFGSVYDNNASNKGQCSGTCPAGTYMTQSPDQSRIRSICKSCPTATYVAFAGAISSTNCTTCSAGLVVVNKTGCRRCDSGLYGINTSATCIKCPVSTYGINGVCLGCPPGKTHPMLVLAFWG